MAGDNNYPLNNLNQCDYAKETTKPDILRNLAPEESHSEKNYNKQRIGDGGTKPLNVMPTSEIGQAVVEDDSEEETKYTRRRKIKRGFCFVAWVFCWPVMLVGLTRRESADAEDADDMKDDPCLPCCYDPYYNPRTQRSSHSL